MTDPVCSLFPASGVQRFVEKYTEEAARQCDLAVHVLPNDILLNREVLSECLADQLRDFGHRWFERIEAEWMAGRLGNAIANDNAPLTETY